MFERIKEIIFKIKDYDRLQHDYSLCLCYFTNNRLSKTNYEIGGLETIICDTIGEYQEIGYKQALQDAADWLKENAHRYIVDVGTSELRHDFIVGGKCWEDMKEELL